MIIISRCRLYPDPPLKPNRTPLSILDATVARFAPTAAVWIYEKAVPIDQLTLSLKKTLNGYPQWAGQLQYSPYNPQGDHTQRQGRLMLQYGTELDPGIEYIIASAPHRHTSLVPEPVGGCLDMDSVPLEELLDATTPLALHNMVDFAELPCMVVQVTTFVDDGIAIAVKLAHPLADAQTLLQFMHDWASVNLAMLGGISMPMISPIFDPQLLDRAAAGDIDATQPDATLVEIARSLPLHRYDWWASSIECPSAFISATVIPCVLGSDVQSSGTPMPWANWDIMAPVSHYVVNFSAQELHAIWLEASSFSSVSHLDALLAHIWSLIARARRIESDEEHYPDVTFSFRNRLHPPLPPSYLGSPLTLTYVTSIGRCASSHELWKMAAAIRTSLTLFDSSSLPALLHEMAFEAGSQRLWNGFLGRRNTIVTSWLQMGVHDVDFGVGTPTYARAIMPRMDGCVQLMEVGEHHSEKRVRWYDESVAVSLHLRDDVMRRLLDDPALRKYRNQ